MDIEHLREISLKNPGSNEAVDLLVALRRKEPGLDLDLEERRIVDAWARRLHSRIPYQGRMSPWLREERENSMRVWVHQQLSEWRPNSEGTTGGPAAFLNSRRQRAAKELPIETGTPADTDEKARRVLAALKAEIEAGGDDRSTLKRRTEVRLLEWHLENQRSKGGVPDLEKARETMRKRGDLKWLERFEELLAETSSYDATLPQHLPRSNDGTGLVADLVDLMIGDLPLQQQQQAVCAPHLQYLLQKEDTRLYGR